MWRHTVKPWHGPLPPRLEVLPRSLGDVLPIDRRAGRNGLLVKLAAVAAEEVLSSPGSSPAEETKGKCNTSDLFSNFERERTMSVHCIGPNVLTQMDQNVAQRTFRYTEGLGCLFHGGGRPIGLHSAAACGEWNHIPPKRKEAPTLDGQWTCFPPSAGEGVAAPSMAGWQREERVAGNR